VVDPSRCSLVLVDPDGAACVRLAGRLRAQGYRVRATTDPAEAATWALGDPPDAVVSNLWMPGISGIQLCQLLIAEPSTAEVPIVLRGDGEDNRNRFFAEKAGATAYVPLGRIGQLARALARAIDAAERERGDVFFTHLSGDQVDIRQRIAQHLDRSLFDSMVTSELRALGTCENFERLFDLFSQFMAQVTQYRWIALRTELPVRFALHTHPALQVSALEEASAVLGGDSEGVTLVLDEDAVAINSSAEPLHAVVSFGGEVMGRVAFAPATSSTENTRLLEIVRKELGGPIRMADLVQESQRLASHDPLTGIMNRRAFIRAVEQELDLPGGGALSMLLIDIDHFKQINDTHGHAAGDEVLGAVGRLLSETTRPNDSAARWGGEEFVIALPRTGADEARKRGEYVRVAIESLLVRTREGRRVPVTVSIGMAEGRAGDKLHDVVERADRAMYTAKVAGRNRLEVA